VIVGLVPLGSHPAGTSRIAWNQRVGGKLLGPGTYGDKSLRASLRALVGVFDNHFLKGLSRRFRGSDVELFRKQAARTTGG
jgi:hypothetical protein